MRSPQVNTKKCFEQLVVAVTRICQHFLTMAKQTKASDFVTKFTAAAADPSMVHAQKENNKATARQQHLAQNQQKYKEVKNES